MKKIALVIFALLITVSVFAKHHKRKKKQVKKAEITSVSLHRTACYGRCPDYTIDLNIDGTAIFTAIRFNPDTGIFTKNIGAQKAVEIINQFKTYRVDTCKNLYQNRRPDIPGLVLTIKYADSAKTIRNAHFGPYFLKQLATSIDEVAKKAEGDNSWKKTGMPKID